jgi:hypothetical protein
MCNAASDDMHHGAGDVDQVGQLIYSIFKGSSVDVSVTPRDHICYQSLCCVSATPHDVANQL